MYKLVTLRRQSPIDMTYLKYIMRQVLGIGGLSGNVESAGVPPPLEGKVFRSNRGRRTIKCMIYMNFKRIAT